MCECVAHDGHIGYAARVGVCHTHALLHDVLPRTAIAPLITAMRRTAVCSLKQ
jgi:hypothetical protein